MVADAEMILFTWGGKECSLERSSCWLLCLLGRILQLDKWEGRCNIGTSSTAHSTCIRHLGTANDWIRTTSSVPYHFTQLYTKHSSQHGFDLEHEKKDHLLQYMDAVVLSGDHVDPFFMKKISRAWNAKRRNALRGCSAVEPIYIYASTNHEERRVFSSMWKFEYAQMLWFGLDDGYNFVKELQKLKKSYEPVSVTKLKKKKK